MGILLGEISMEELSIQELAQVPGSGIFGTIGYGVGWVAHAVWSSNWAGATDLRELCHA